MKILQLHNKYRHYGGEDAVVDNEHKLLLNNGFEVEQLFFNNENISPSNLYYNKESYITTLRRIEKFKPDILHLHNVFYNASPSVLKAAKKTNTPIVMTLHNYRLLCSGALFLRNSKVCTKCKDRIIPYHGVIHKCFQDSYLKSVVLSSFIGINKMKKTWTNSIDRFIVLTPFIKDLFLNSSLNINAENIVVKPNSTDDLIVAKSKKIQNRFLYVGRLSKEKGVDTLVKAFNKIPEMELDIIGSGNLETHLKRIAHENIKFHGSQNREYIKEKLNIAKALLFPSIWYEGLPNTLIEAFSTGTPVLSSNIENINEIVISEYNGETFTPNNVESLIEKVLEFSNKNTEQYGLNSRQSFEDTYTHQKNLENLSKIYSQLKLDYEKTNNKY